MDNKNVNEQMNATGWYSSMKPKYSKIWINVCIIVSWDWWMTFCSNTRQCLRRSQFLGGLVKVLYDWIKCVQNKISSQN